MKELVKKINSVAQENLLIAVGMLDMLNDIYGTHFVLLNKRVVICDNFEFGTAEMYAHCLDAYTNL